MTIYAAPSPMSDSIGHVILPCLILVSHKLLSSSGCFWVLKVMIFWEINLD